MVTWHIPSREVKITEMILMAKYINAHKHSSNHKELLLKDNKCGCFYCLAIFAPSEIEEWVEDALGTAICPYCGIDSVIGESSGYPITKTFLKRMELYWF